MRSEASVENLLIFLYCSEICFVRTTLSSSLHQCNPNPTKASNTHQFASDMEYRKIKDEVKSLPFFFFPPAFSKLICDLQEDQIGDGVVGDAVTSRGGKLISSLLLD